MIGQTGGGKPHISVIIPLYNKQRYVLRALGSALAQTYRDFEVVIVDDGSTDEGPALARSSFPNESRIRIVRQENSGLSAARNRGLAEMRGEIAAFLDADDEWLSQHLEDIAETARLYPEAGILATGYRQIVRDGFATETTIVGDFPVLIHDYFDKAARVFPMHISSCAARADVAREVGGFAGARGEDLEFYARVALKYPIGYHPRVSGIYYRNTLGSKLTSEGVCWDASEPPVAQTLRRIALGSEMADDLRRSVRDYTAAMLWRHALGGVIAGAYPDAAGILSDPLIRDSSMEVSARRLRLAMKLAPHRLLALHLRFRQSRWSLRKTQIINGVVTRWA